MKKPLWTTGCVHRGQSHIHETSRSGERLTTFIDRDGHLSGQCPARVRNSKQSAGGAYCFIGLKWIPPAVLGLENVHSPDDVLSAYRAFAHAFPTFCAGDHVTALQQHTVNHSVHADTTQVVIAG